MPNGTPVIETEQTPRSQTHIGPRGALGLVLCLGTLVIGALRPSSALAWQGQPVAEIPFELHRNKILVPVHIAGIGPYQFILDTGSPVTVLSSFVQADTLSLEVGQNVQIGGAGAGSPPRAGMSNQTVVHIGDIALPSERLVVMDIGEALARASGRVYDGIIGRSVFARYVVQLDFQHHIMTLFDPSHFEPPDGAYVIPIRLEGGHPHIDARVFVNDSVSTSRDLVVDTGARTALALNRDAKRGILPPRDSMRMIVGHGARGIVRGTVGRINRLVLGDTALSDVLTVFVDSTLGLAPRANGNLGTEILRRFRTTFDYRNSRLILEPTSEVNAPFFVDLSGLTFEATGADWSDLSVSEVRAGSPSETAGIMTGDVLVALDGRAAWTLEEMDNRLSQVGTARLTVKRGSRRIEFELDLSHVLE